MTTNFKKLGALLGVVAIGIAVASAAGAASKASHSCLSASTIKIGSTFPLSEGPQTGGASLYKTIAGAEQAYYSWVNAHCGVNHHAIKDKVLDDQYMASETLPDDKQLVESDHVFAIVGSLGTQPGLQTMNYLNSKKVPQVLLATGDSYWGDCSKTGAAFKPIKNVCTSPKPWTMGWQPDYRGEGYLYGKYILAHKTSPKIGVLYQSDGFGQDSLAGLQKGLGSHKSDIVHTEAYAVGEDSSSISTRVQQIYGHGANVLVIFATPGSAIAALGTESAIPHWSPLTILSNVSANRVFMLAAEGPPSNANVNGVVSTTYVKSETANSGNSAIALAHKIIFATKDTNLEQQFSLGDLNLIYGLGVAWTFVDALKHAGTNPTRTSLMHALRNLNESGANKNPFLYPGMVVKTSSKQTFPMTQLQFVKWSGQTAHATGDWAKVGGILTSGT